MEKKIFESGEVLLLSKDVPYAKLPIMGSTKGYFNNQEYHRIIRNNIYSLYNFVNTYKKPEDKCYKDFYVAYNFYLEHMQKLMEDYDSFSNGLELFDKDLEKRKQIFNQYREKIYEYFIENGLPFFTTDNLVQISAYKVFSNSYSPVTKRVNNNTFDSIFIDYLVLSEFEDKKVDSFQKFIKK